MRHREEFFGQDINPLILTSEVDLSYQDRKQSDQNTDTDNEGLALSTDTVYHFPVVERGNELFMNHPKARYYVGVLAVRDRIIMPEAFLAARRLRFNKYHALGLLSDSDQDEDGGEHDEDDGRSIQFGVIKNLGEDDPQMIATSRLILRGDKKLPVEKYFPDFFENRETPETEISRLVSVSGKGERGLATLACYRAMMGVGVAAGYRTTAAVTESWLINKLDKLKIPHVAGSMYRTLDDYADNAPTAPLAIDSAEIIEKSRIFGSMPLMPKIFFRGIKSNKGIGYYDKTMLRRR